MAYCIYLRKSRADTELERLGEGETLARHRRTLTELAEKRGYIIGEVYEEIVSGETIAARPQMQRLLADVEQGTWQGVLVMELERLARGNSIDQGIVAQAFQLTNTLIITPNKVFDPRNEFDEEYFEFGLFMSRREYKTINRRLQAGRIASVKEGNYIGTYPPFGYDKVRLEHGKGFTLAKNDESPYIKMIFEWYVNDGLSAIKIADRLTQMGVRPKKGGTYFSQHSIRDILRNYVYTGKVTWNWRKNVKTIQDGKVKISRPKNPPENMIICEGKHEAIISDELFQAAQERTGSNPKVKRGNELVNPFAHVMHCKECSRSIVLHKYKTETMLMCPNKYCSVSGAAFEVIEQSVLQQLNAEIGALKIEVERGTINDNITIKTQIRKYEQEHAKVKQQQDKLYDLLEQDIYTPEIFAERQSALRKKQDEISAELLRLRQKTNEPTDYTKTINTLDELLEHYEELTVLQKNNLLRQSVKDIKYYREKSDRFHPKPISLEIELLI